MSDAAAAPAVAATDERVPLDRVMLAMDVVDTLRHQRDLVERELDDEQRRREFVQQVQAIYDAQGIDVPGDVVAEAVQALEQDRFVYTPPRRTFAVRLAEIYVERGKWALRAGIVALLSALLYAGYAVPAHYARRSLIDGFSLRVAEAMASAEGLLERSTRTAEEQAALADDAARPAVADKLARADAATRRARSLAEAALTALLPRPDPREYPADRANFDRRLGQVDESLGDSAAELHNARRLLDDVRELRGLAGRLAASLQRLDGLELGAAERAAVGTRSDAVRAAIDLGDGSAGARALSALIAEIDGIFAARQQQADLRQRLASLTEAATGLDAEPAATQQLTELRDAAQNAITAADWSRAASSIAALDALIARLEQSYELRIVSRPGINSGAWRYHVDDDGRRTQARNYYLIVEALGPDGRVIPMSITSEEDQRTRRVRTFGLRVPESVYERVKQDKIDNGIVDEPIVGTKRRGALEPEYRVEVLGGKITQW